MNEQAPPPHIHGEGYSASNPVPSVKKFLAAQEARSNPPPPSIDPPRASEVEEGDHAKEVAQEKEEMMRKATAEPVTAQNLELKGPRTVVDPITATRVDIEDNRPAAAYKAAPDVLPTNILTQNFPPPVSTEGLAQINATLSTYARNIALGLVALWLLTAARRWSPFLTGAVIVVFAGSVYAAHGIVANKLEKELDRMRMNMERQRGLAASPPTPESTEWLNALISTIWQEINPAMFEPLVDMIEDVLQASLPSFVDAVKITDFALGNSSLRIVSMRGLPDRPGDAAYPRKEWIDQGASDKETGKEASDQDDSDGGDFVNLEVAFAYSPPPQATGKMVRKISLLVEFFLGAYDWLHIPIPIWIAVESFAGTVRLRLQIVDSAPFVKNVTFSLMGVPSVKASAIPMTKLLPNVLDLPFVSSLVQSAIAAAAYTYVAPRSMTLNIMQILSGDGIKKDTKALGVLEITIHHAVDLSAQDSNGFSDPYVVASFEKFGKPLYSTRIIPRTLCPVWEETFFLLVTADEVKAAERLSIQLWDSDRFSADDLVGRLSVSLFDIMAMKGKEERKDKLMGFEDADSLSGELSWSIAYHDKAKLRHDLKKEPGIDHSLPVALQSRPELQVETKAVDSSEEQDVLRTSPDPLRPSGVLSVIIHHINNLEKKDLSGSMGKGREGEAGQDTDDASDENPPSGYCELILNDELVYKTRVKQYAANPHYEAGGEFFVRDWTTTSVRVVVRDSRLREHDPILGVVDLPLDKVLSHASQSTQLYALQSGVGFGRVQISILFKSVEAQLPKNQLGWSTGTVCVVDHVRLEPVEGSTFEFKEKKLVVSTSEASQKLAGSVANIDTSGKIQWDVDESIRLPTYNRYASAIFFDYGSAGGISLGASAPEAFASFYLHDLVDDEPTAIRIPIVTSKEIKSLRHNVLNEQTLKTHEMTIVGYLCTTVIVVPGLDLDHESYATAQGQTRRHEFETYEHVEGGAKSAEQNSHANDDGVIDQDEARAIKKAHAKALSQQHRGPMQFRAVRTAKWSKDSMKDRIRRVKEKMLGTAAPTTIVASEAAP